MILLASIPLGIAAGLVLGGRLDGLQHLRIKWAQLALLGLAVQIVLFTPAGAAMAGDLGPAIYVGSTFAVLVAVLRNVRVAAFPIIALGAFSNLVAIVANGGVMPTTAEALAAAGLEGSGTGTNSAVLPNPALAPLTDIFAIPAGVPLANVFSVGDVLIGVGVAAAIALAMRRGAGPTGAATPASPA